MCARYEQDVFAINVQEICKKYARNTRGICEEHARNMRMNIKVTNKNVARVFDGVFWEASFAFCDD